MELDSRSVFFVNAVRYGPVTFANKTFNATIGWRWLLCTVIAQELMYEYGLIFVAERRCRVRDTFVLVEIDGQFPILN